MKVDISGLDKRDVLVALYEHANYRSEPLKHKFSTVLSANLLKKGSYDSAHHAISNATAGNHDYFSTVNLGHGPRALNVDLSGDSFDATTYDKKHGGLGSAQRAIDTLRQKLQPIPSQEPKKPSVNDLLGKVRGGLFALSFLRSLPRPVEILIPINSIGNNIKIITEPHADGEYDNNTNHHHQFP